MCGIFFYYGLKKDTGFIYKQFIKIKERGPNNSHIFIEDNIFIGFHRLMINDLSYNGNQPMFFNESILVCNGEIYNSKELIEKYNLQCRSSSDCETIIQLYNCLKNIYLSVDDVVNKLCQELDGEFAFVIYDKLLQKIIVARDRYGVRPLFVGHNDDNNEFGFASELKSLDLLFNNVEQFTPSMFNIFDLSSKTSIKKKYYEITNDFDITNNNEKEILIKIKKALEDAVEKRLSGDVPICALLSGGLDSSLVCGIITEKLGKGVLNTFSIGMKGSTDLFYAKKVAEHIGSIHHEVIVTEQEMLNSINEVIGVIESYDITTVRASIPHFLISKYIKNNTNFKCILSGEMSDEMMGGYLYFKKAPNTIEFHNETNKLLENICYFDNLRADRSISSQGLEARAPFSDHHLAKLIQSINPELRCCNDKIEKYLLRKAFDNSDIIPKDILWREKEAFSDAVSSKTNSWYKIIQNHIDTLITDEEFQNNSLNYKHCTPLTKEAYYYRTVFEAFYENDKVIPYFWMPNQKWVGNNIIDPSARELTD